ncbi:hypothetical protein AB0395_16980 [Streptosporangium sp. NPDC051023]|uniref:hypothetical protein n=1 Tax=Streptosporangium sp. NPDC051023 TaxID=3155410 RepID=UPI00344EB163
MKRYIAGLACAATAALSVPALASTAHAQAADPVTALKSKLGSGQGVTFVDKTKIYTAGKSAVIVDRTGTLQFGPSGIVASDQTGKLRLSEKDLKELNDALAEADQEDQDDAAFIRAFAGLAKPERVVRIGRTSYISGGFFGEFLPAGKTWLRFPGDSLGIMGSMTQSVNAAEPETLKALLAHATTKRTGFYSGKITYGELFKVSPWLRASLSGERPGALSKTAVNWKLYVGADQLPQRLTTTYVAYPDKTVTTYDTTYSGWGSKVSIKAPAPETVAKPQELQLTKPEAQIPIIRSGVDALANRSTPATSRGR